jgi:hypothetical protein
VPRNTSSGRLYKNGMHGYHISLTVLSNRLFSDSFIITLFGMVVTWIRRGTLCQRNAQG